jgi:hypothetical protein
MLAREKKRAAWSLAIGAFCASAILGWEYRKARIAESNLPALVERCKVDARKVDIPPGSVPIPPGTKIEPPVGRHSGGLYIQDASGGRLRRATPQDLLGAKFYALPGVCEPDTLADGELQGYDLTPGQQQIADAWDAQSHKTWPFGIAAFAVFCLPLIWYFLLDRIRELGAAISGRDRSP